MLKLPIVNGDIDLSEYAKKSDVDAINASLDNKADKKEVEKLSSQLDNYTIAERERVDNENLRVAGETGRVSAEKTRVSQESARVTAELGRVNAESERVAAEKLRATAEQNRETAITDIKAENKKFTDTITTEFKSVKEQEIVRIAQEEARVTAEQNRITAEQNREENARTLEARVNEKISEYNTATLITNAEIDSIIANALK